MKLRNNFLAKKFNQYDLLFCLLAFFWTGAAEYLVVPCPWDSENMTDVYTFIHDVQLLSASNMEFRVRLDDLNERLNDQRDLMSELRAKMNNIHANGIYEKKPPKKDVRDIFNIPDSTVDTEDICSIHQRFPQSCAEATANSRKSGRYLIQDNLAEPTPFWVSCDEELYGGAWTVIKRRFDGKFNFTRNWAEYKQGFGSVDGEHWIGLDRLYAMTTRNAQELLIVMEDFDNVRRHAKYDAFAIGDESEAYALKVLGKFSGDAGDSLTGHEYNKWSTFDRENDRSTRNCAQLFGDAWWYGYCYNSLYLRGTFWHAFRGYALKFMQVMIRPRRL